MTTQRNYRARIREMLADPATPFRVAWILERWLQADPVDAANEAEALSEIMSERAQDIANEAIRRLSSGGDAA